MATRAALVGLGRRHAPVGHGPAQDGLDLARRVERDRREVGHVGLASVQIVPDLVLLPVKVL